MKLLLSISLFLSALIDTHARVSNNFAECQNFFYKGQIPTGFQGIAKSNLFDPNDLPDGINNKDDLASPAYICQTNEETIWFATLYDRGRLMPLYSAYILDIKEGEASKECGRPKSFKVEPQLVYRAVNKNMAFLGDAMDEIKNYNKNNEIDERKPKNRPSFLLTTSQAPDEEYKLISKDYDRGHINPCGHQSGMTHGYKATFTMTNVVPMAKKLNKEIWNDYEQEMIGITAQCTQTYVITGIVPGNVPIKKTRLTSPEYIWNAYCCVDNNGKPMKSGAALAENKEESKVIKYELSEFQSELQNLLGVSHTIELFQGGCKHQNV